MQKKNKTVQFVNLKAVFPNRLNLRNLKHFQGCLSFLNFTIMGLIQFILRFFSPTYLIVFRKSFFH